MRAISASARCALSVSVLFVCAMSAPPRADVYHTRPAAHQVECRHPERAVTKGEASMANVLTVVAKVRAAKGKGDALAALLAEQAGVVKKAEPGCLVYR